MAGVTSRCLGLVVMTTALLTIGNIRLAAEPVMVRQNAGESLTDEQRDAILEAHNYYRRREYASNMMELTYNYELEVSARWAASRCNFMHYPLFSIRYRDAYTSENIFTTNFEFDITLAVREWWAETYNYTYETNHCSLGPIACGHYTAVVWASIREVGCAASYCKAINNWAGDGVSGFVLFCHYSPSGNKEGSRPYKIGRPCRDCPPDAQFCNDGLCSLKSTETKLPTVTTPTSERRCNDSWFWLESGAKCYKLFPTRSNYTTAKSKCSENGADIVTIKSEAEQFDFRSRFSSKANTWLGAVYSEETGEFTWDDNTDTTLDDNSGMTWMNWRNLDMTDVLREDRLCSVVTATGYWKAAKCRSKRRFVCQRSQ